MIKFFLLIPLLFSFLASACPLTGKVIKITDGDTITILDSKRKQHKIRLAGIDTPERKQPYGKKAKKYLSSLVGRKTVCIDWHKKDRYGRIVGKVILNNQDINYQLVKTGLAWHYKKYQKEQSQQDRKSYSDAEKVAKLSVIGLWQEPDAIAPWEWRKGARSVRLNKKQKYGIIQQKRQVKTPKKGFSRCGSKRFCKNMDSCAEARFYLTQCGLSRLDRDRDGIPCESICR